MNGTRNPAPIDLGTVNAAAVAARIDKTDSRGCWRWAGGKGANGYGYVSRGRSLPKLLAHRLIYTMHRGQIPEGKVLDHLCRNRSCVNPAHLEPVTVAENNRRGFGASGIHGRQTHCLNGHEFSPANTYNDPSGARHCRTCMRASDRKRVSGWARQRASQERKSA